MGILERGLQNTGHALGIIGLFALGGALAFPTGLFVARILERDGGCERAFATAFLSFGICTIGLTGLCYVVFHLTRHGGWPAGGPAAGRAVRTAFTVLGALFEFAAFGMRMYIPVGLAALFMVAAWRAWPTR